MVFWTFLMGVGLARLLAVFTENVNWDEFGLLQRAVLAEEGGQLLTGGRPGLGTLLLVPFATECANAVDALVRARILWTGMFGATAVTLWFFLKEFLPSRPYRSVAVAIGFSLWVLAPPVLRFSTQVRTDQPAILFGLLGGLVLLRSRRQILWAPVAGLLFAIGFLFSQKLLYVAALVVLLAAGRLFVVSEWRPRREIVRLLLSAIAFLAVLVAYRQVMSRWTGAPSLLPMAGGLRTFEYYREHVGWGHYGRMLPLLMPQLVLAGTLLAFSVHWLRTRGDHGRELLVAWVIVLAGIGVAVFHAGRFPYFYMVLGLFPACVGALVAGPILKRVRSPLYRFALGAIVVVPLAGLAVLQAAAFTVDTQSHQRESLGFVERNFPADARGFATRAEFACRRDPDPFPTWYTEHVRFRFGGEEGEMHAQEVMDSIREREVAFMIFPWPEDPYPEQLWNFWKTRFVPYSGSIAVAGRQIDGRPGWSGHFEVIAPGTYVWRPSSDGSASLEVRGELLPPGGTIQLPNQGLVQIELPDGGTGLFVLALDEPPSASGARFFRGL